MNTALIIHLLTDVQHHIHGHHFRGFTVFECFEWVKVRTAGVLDRRLVCGTIHVWQHGVVMKWR